MQTCEFVHSIPCVPVLRWGDDFVSRLPPIPAPCATIRGWCRFPGCFHRGQGASLPIARLGSCARLHLCYLEPLLCTTRYR
jgi:hypothetical protein